MRNLIILLMILSLVFPYAVSADDNVKIEIESYKTGSTEYKIVLKTEIKDGVHLYAPGETNGIPVKIELKNRDIQNFSINYPDPVIKKYEQLGGELKLYEGKTDFSINLKAEIEEINIDFNYQACTDTQCFMPETQTFSVKIKDAIQNIIKKENENSVNKEENVQETEDEYFAAAYKKYGLIYVILLAFIFGVISSLTPCIYPMIPITVAYFGNKKTEGDKEVESGKFLMSLVFVIGIGLSFATLGAFFTYLGRDLGSIFASSWAASIISLLLLIFAMASFEFFELKPPSFLMSKIGNTNQKGYFGSLVMGLTLGLIAAPCVGPIAGSLLIFVATLKNVTLGFILLFVYGLGLGSLFMVVALGASFLPGAGMWMVTLKKIFGIVILFTTIYIMQFAIPQWMLLIYSGVIFIFSSIVLSVFNIKDAYTNFSDTMEKTLAVTFLVTGILLLSGGIFTFLPSNQVTGTSVSEEISLHSEWMKDHDKAIEKGKLEGKPVFLDFYADWCAPCKIMSKRFKEKEIAEELKRFVKAKLDCTKPEYPSAILKQSKYKVPFMPYMIFYDKNGNLIKSKTIKGEVSSEEFLKILRSIQ